jgi:hypothetical protein
MATKPVDPIQAYLASVGAAGFDPNGRPVGSTGGLVSLSPDQEQQLAGFRQPQQAPAAPANPLDKLNGLLGTNIGAPVMGQRMEQAVSQLPGGVQIAGGLAQQNDAQKAALFAQRMQETGGMPVPGAPEYAARAKAAESIYNQIYGQQQGNSFMPGNAYMGGGPAPTGAEVLAAGGREVVGYGGTRISGQVGPNGNNQFTLRQAPQSSFMPQSAPVASQLPANGPSDAAMAFLRTGVAPQEPNLGQFQPPSAQPSAAQAMARQQAPNALQMAQEQYRQALSPASAKPNLGTDQEIGPDGRARYIPGSEGETKAKEQASKANLRQRNAAENAQSVISFIDAALPEVSGLTAGVGAAVLSKLPATDARDLSAKIDTIKANIGFDRLQQMRQESPTGGALGQVAVKELDFLQSVRGSLDNWQSPAELKKNLGIVRKSYERFMMANAGFDPDTKEDREAFYAQAGTPAGTETITETQTTVSFTPDKAARLAELKAKLGK